MLGLYVLVVRTEQSLSAASDVLGSILVTRRRGPFGINLTLSHVPSRISSFQAHGDERMCLSALVEKVTLYAGSFRTSDHISTSA